ncbi:MAG: TlyA family RNA methyltransferase [Pseudomonadota bacterium]
MVGTSHSTDKKMRLDLLLTETGHFETRARARDAILRGTVLIDGVPCTRPGARFGANTDIRIEDAARAYVSRAALKLAEGLDAFQFDPRGRAALDIGASTGGFTQVLLDRGAAHVIAVDVGHDQLHQSLRDDPRVSNREGINARSLPQDISDGRKITVVVSDVSFISLRLALPPALTLSAAGSFCVLLVKPQFEAGKAAIGKGGILKDPAKGPVLAQTLSEWLDRQPGWTSKGICPSPIQGADGNQEFLLGGIKS